MNLKISIFTIVILLFILHTIITHLFNWWVRVFIKDEDPLIIFIIGLNLIELVICTAILSNWLT